MVRRWLSGCVLAVAVCGVLPTLSGCGSNEATVDKSLTSKEHEDAFKAKMGDNIQNKPAGAEAPK